jgi:hypothetical protein
MAAGDGRSTLESAFLPGFSDVSHAHAPARKNRAAALKNH